MNKLLMVSVAAVIVTAGGSAQANAEPVAYTGNPIDVVRYSIEPSYSMPAHLLGGTELGIPGSDKVTISFVNAGSAPATSVQFAVHTGKTTEMIVDKGTFSPGTSITHEFALSPGLGDASTIDVEKVTFADGSSWQLG